MQVLHCPNFRSKGKEWCESRGRKWMRKKQVKCGAVLLWISPNMLKHDFTAVVPCKQCRKLIKLIVKDGVSTTRTIDKGEIGFEEKLLYIPENVHCYNV